MAERKKSSHREKKYRYYLQVRDIDWSLMPKKVRKKLEGRVLYLKESSKLTLKRQKAISFPDLTRGETAAEDFVECIYKDFRKRYGAGAIVDVVRLKKKTA